MNKKLIAVGLCAFALGALGQTLYGQEAIELGDINTILEDNSLRDITTRYTSVLSYFFPEEASRLGITSADSFLNDRSPLTQQQAIDAFRSIQKSLASLDEKTLSVDRQTDYVLLREALEATLWRLEHQRLNSDPVYYAQALDAVYELTLTPAGNFTRKQRRDLLSRLAYLPRLTAQAKENLTNVSPVLASVAMEKAYFAYLSFDEIVKRVNDADTGTNDPRDHAVTEERLKRAKQSLRELFDFFKMLSAQTQDNPADPRLGPALYQGQLKAMYQIADKPAALGAWLTKQLDQSQRRLFDVLQLFELKAEDEEITVVEDANQIPQVQPVNQPAAKSQAKKTAKPVYVPPTANQFYAVAKQLKSPFEADQVLSAFTQQTAAFEDKLFKEQLIPSTATMKIQPLSTYFAYLQSYRFSPGFGAFLLRLPSGNKLAQEEMLQRDFNEPTYKLLISQELVPGRYYQFLVTKNAIRRLFGSVTLANGWTLYALQLAEKDGYLLSDEDRLFVAWQQYLRALAAWVDFKLHTQVYTYKEAFDLLVEQHGFTQEESAEMLNRVLQAPGQAVSFVWGAQVWEKAAAPYLKKGKQGGNLLLLKVGNVSPNILAEELKREYKK